MNISNQNYDLGLFQPYALGGATALLTTCVSGTPNFFMSAMVMVVDRFASIVLKKIEHHKEVINKSFSAAVGLGAVTTVNQYLSKELPLLNYVINCLSFVSIYKLVEAAKPSETVPLITEAALVIAAVAFPVLRDDSPPALKGFVNIISAGIVGGLVFNDFLLPAYRVGCALFDKNTKWRMLPSGKVMILSAGTT